MKLLKHRWGEKRPKTFFKSSHVVSINKAAPLAFCPNLFMCRAASYSCQPSSFGANYTLEMRAGICHGIRFLTVYSDLQRALVARRIIASTHTQPSRFYLNTCGGDRGEESLLMAGWTWIETNSHIKLTEKSRWKKWGGKINKFRSRRWARKKGGCWSLHKRISAGSYFNCTK